jgi:hypothetical protein
MKRIGLKVALGFALVGYLGAVGLYFAASMLRLSPVLGFAICPAYLLVMISMTDPSFGAIALIIAPLNAVLYGIVGLLIGFGVEGVVTRTVV